MQLTCTRMSRKFIGWKGKIRVEQETQTSINKFKALLLCPLLREDTGGLWLFVTIASTTSPKDCTIYAIWTLKS